MTPQEAREQQKAMMLSHHGDGRHTFDECKVCGWVGWRSTERTAPTEIVIVEQPPGFMGCPLCAEVQQRAPETFRWVTGVAAKLQRLIAEAAEAGAR